MWLWLRLHLQQTACAMLLVQVLVRCIPNIEQKALTFDMCSAVQIDEMDDVCSKGIRGLVPERASAVTEMLPFHKMVLTDRCNERASNEPGRVLRSCSVGRSQ